MDVSAQLRAQALPMALKVLEFAIDRSRIARGLDVADPDPEIYDALLRDAAPWLAAARQAEREFAATDLVVLVDGMPAASGAAGEVRPGDGVTVGISRDGQKCSVTAVPLPKVSAWAWEGPKCASTSTR